MKEMTKEEKEKIESEITEILQNAVSNKYAKNILELKDDTTGNTLMNDIIKNIVQTAAWSYEKYYNDIDLKLAIGKELLTRLDIKI